MFLSWGSVGSVCALSLSFSLSWLPPKSAPLLVRAVFGGRRHRSSSHHWSIFHFPLVLSCLPSHLVPIPSITLCVFNPLYPLMSLTVSVRCMYWYFVCYGVRRVLYPLSLFCKCWFSEFQVPISFSCAWLPCHQHAPHYRFLFFFD